MYGEDLLRFAHSLADVADAITIAAFLNGGKRTITKKDDGSSVSDIDIAVETALLEQIRELRPNDGILIEESGQVAIGRFCWVIDPLDGTHAFLAGKDTWGTLIALEEDGVPFVGVVSMPVRESRWSGLFGEGAFLSRKGTSKRIFVNERPVSDSLRWTSNPHPDLLDSDSLRRLSGLVSSTAPVHYNEWTTYPALMVADGTLDCCVHFGSHWDHAAHGAIVRSAGGFYALDSTDRSGRSAALFSSAPHHRHALAALSTRP